MASTKQRSGKVLILGASSFVGRRLFSYYGAENSVATYNRNNIDGAIYFDVRNMRLADVVSDFREFSHAVILVGYTNPEYCFLNPEESNYMNVVKIKEMITDLSSHGITPLFTSTESVFDGIKGGYVETDQVNPLFTYAGQKAEVERFIFANCKKHIIVRLARVFGSDPGDGTLFTSWLKQMDASEDIVCAKDQVFSPIHVHEAVRAIAGLIEKDCEGIYHVAGKDPFSRLKMLETLLFHYLKRHTYRGRIKECSLRDFKTSEERPFNISLESGKMEKTVGLERKSLGRWCEEIVNGRQERDAAKSITDFKRGGIAGG
jgi:dTDP-4-dehydrorhamnose reductase